MTKPMPIANKKSRIKPDVSATEGEIDYGAVLSNLGNERSIGNFSANNKKIVSEAKAEMKREADAKEAEEKRLADEKEAKAKLKKQEDAELRKDPLARLRKPVAPPPPTTIGLFKG